MLDLDHLFGEDHQPLVSTGSSKVEFVGIKKPAPATPKSTLLAGQKSAPDGDELLPAQVRETCATLESKSGARLDGRIDVSTTEPCSPASSVTSIAAALLDPASQSQPQSPAAATVTPQDIGGMPVAAKLEQAIQDSLKESGKFGMRGTTLGYQWGMAVKQSPALADEYAQHKGYVAQREFRAKWVSRLWSVISETRTKKEQIAETDRSDAIFYPNPTWFQEDGGGPEAAEGVEYFLNMPDCTPRNICQHA